MSNRNLHLQRESLSDMIGELLQLTNDVDEVMLKSADAYGEAGIKAVQQSYLSIPGASTGDFIYSSIGFRMLRPPNASAGTVAWGGIGVYYMPSIHSRFGKTDKDFTAAQIAYWFEHGITRFKSGGSKPSRIRWSDVDPEKVVSTTPQPFISQAAISGLDQMESAFIEKFNELMR